MCAVVCMLAHFNGTAKTRLLASEDKKKKFFADKMSTFTLRAEAYTGTKQPSATCSVGAGWRKWYTLLKAVGTGQLRGYNKESQKADGWGCMAKFSSTTTSKISKPSSR